MLTNSEVSRSSHGSRSKNRRRTHHEMDNVFLDEASSIVVSTYGRLAAEKP